MKKSLIALAVAGAMTAPMIAQADATLYGISEMRIIDKDQNDLDLQVNKMRLGVRGDDELENLDGVTGIYQFEWEFAGNPDDVFSDNVADANGKELNLRKAMVGMRGGFGNLEFGKTNNPAVVTKTTDQFKTGSGFRFNTSDRIANAVVYQTPMISGFQGFAAIGADTEGSDVKKDVDATVIGAQFEVAGLFVAAAFTDVANEYLGTANDEEITNVGASYSIGDLGLALAWEQTDTGTANDDEQTSAAVSYALGNAVLKAGYDQFDDGSADDSTQWILHAGYKLGAKSYAFVQYNDLNDDDVADTASANQDSWSLGYSIAF